MTFENWFFKSKCKTYTLQGAPVPLSTTLLYYFSSNDSNKFDALCNILEDAYNAGKAETNTNEHLYLFTNVQSGDKVYSLDAECKDCRFGMWTRTTFILE